MEHVSSAARLRKRSAGPDLNQALTALWSKFRQINLDRVACIADVARALATGTLEEPKRRVAEREVHKLVGAIGSFGFTEGSRLARLAEQLLQSDSMPHEQCAAQLEAIVASLVHELLQEARPIARDPTPANRNQPATVEALLRETVEGLMDRATFFAIMGAFPTGVAIVTTLDERDQPRGLTSNALCSVSADPPLLLLCVDRNSNTLPALRHTRKFVVNYLSAGRGELANLFASKEPDKFQNVSWRPGSNGMPWLHTDTIAHAECSVSEEIEAGDHLIFIGKVEDGQPPAPGTKPLMYFRRTYGTWHDHD